jgi:dTDP-glucose 4,6-dehydratase
MSDEPEPVNIGNPQEISMVDLARRIVEVTGSSSEIEFVPLPVDDPKVRRPDTTRARTLLGWEPTVGLDDGLRRTLRWFSGALSVSAAS